MRQGFVPLSDYKGAAGNEMYLRGQVLQKLHEVHPLTLMHLWSAATLFACLCFDVCVTGKMQ